MKKIVCLMFILVFLSFNSFAADLADKLTSTQLSNNVTGVYFSNASAAGANDATSYALSTGHTQGNKVYASGNFVSDIYIQDSSAPVDNLLSSGGSFDSSTFDSTWTAL